MRRVFDTNCVTSPLPTCTAADVGKTKGLPFAEVRMSDVSRGIVHAALALSACASHSSAVAFCQSMKLLW